MKTFLLCLCVGELRLSIHLFFTKEEDSIMELLKVSMISFLKSYLTLKGFVTLNEEEKESCTSLIKKVSYNKFKALNQNQENSTLD